MSIRKEFTTKTIGFAAAASMITMFSSVPAAADIPMCNLYAYQVCTDGQWQSLGYASMQECLVTEQDICEVDEYIAPEPPHTECVRGVHQACPL